MGAWSLKNPYCVSSSSWSLAGNSSDSVSALEELTVVEETRWSPEEQRCHSAGQYVIICQVTAPVEMLGSLHEEALPKLVLRDKGGIQRWDKGFRPRCMETRTESL